jgi:hypothetical protein
MHSQGSSPSLRARSPAPDRTRSPAPARPVSAVMRATERNRRPESPAVRSGSGSGAGAGAGAGAGSDSLQDLDERLDALQRLLQPKV